MSYTQEHAARILPAEAARLAKFQVCEHYGRIEVRSVLGDARTTSIREGGGFPWFNCPFCSSGVYIQGPSPDAAVSAFTGRDCECSNPCCLANPAMPLDAARAIQAKEIERQNESDARKRNHELAMNRIRADRASRDAAEDAGRAECTARRACFRCWRETRGRFVKHRAECPRSRTRTCGACLDEPSRAGFDGRGNGDSRSHVARNLRSENSEHTSDSVRAQ